MIITKAKSKSDNSWGPSLRDKVASRTSHLDRIAYMQWEGSPNRTLGVNRHQTLAMVPLDDCPPFPNPPFRHSRSILAGGM